MRHDSKERDYSPDGKTQTFSDACYLCGVSDGGAAEYFAVTDAVAQSWLSEDAPAPLSAWVQLANDYKKLDRRSDDMSSFFWGGDFKSEGELSDFLFPDERGIYRLGLPVNRIIISFAILKAFSPARRDFALALGLGFHNDPSQEVVAGKNFIDAHIPPHTHLYDEVLWICGLGKERAAQFFDLPQKTIDAMRTGLEPVPWSMWYMLSEIFDSIEQFCSNSLEDFEQREYGNEELIKGLNLYHFRDEDCDEDRMPRLAFRVAEIIALLDEMGEDIED